ncbi:unnamed protein product [Dracunculus medinensis]|uniref:Uncharacterized protein n=1 Tax=Dracunculus medinensis TaxID=318479 RepID=A0A0N4UGJ1_DRAME|nr:unnamed protein product [Dracunculus medinensis]
MIADMRSVQSHLAMFSDCHHIIRPDSVNNQLTVPHHWNSVTGRASPSVAGSMASDPESCLDDNRCINDDSDSEMIS